MITQISYTNSRCSDLWEMFIKENQRHTKMPLYIISDKIPENYGQKDTLIYFNGDQYYKVWSNAIEKFGNNYFIYLQEDFVLYNDVNQIKIDEYVEFLKTNPQYSFVRLLKSGKLNEKKITSTLYEIESTNLNIFSMQPTIWKSADYLKLLNLVKGSEWWEYEEYRNKMIELNMAGLYHYNGERKIGSAHYDSDVYPYIATALVKGKWNIREYSIELNKMLIEYKIDVNKRGF